MSNHEQITLSKDGVPFVDMLVPLPAEQPALFVVLHGLISLVEGESEFRAYPLSAGPTHEYRLGDWLSEVPMAVGLRASLAFGAPVEPVTRTAENTLNPALTPVTKVAAFPDDSSLGPEVLARIILPRPAKLHLLNLGSISLSGGDRLLQPTESISGVVVFEYHFPKGVDAALVSEGDAGVVWRANNQSGAAGSRVTSLHILSQPPADVVVPVTHPVDEFESSSAFLGFPEIKISDVPVDFTLDQQPEPPKGLPYLEIVPYATRNILLEKVRDFLRTARWESSQALSGDCRSCCSALRAVIR